MFRSLILIAVVSCSFTGISSAQPGYQAVVRPEHRNNIMALKSQQFPLSDYDLEIIPNPNEEYEYGIIDVADDAVSTVSNIVLAPVNAVLNIASKALSCTKYVLKQSVWVLLGAGLVIGFCAFTPYCTLTIEAPFSRELQSWKVPYLDEVEYFLAAAYDKYQAMQ